MFDTYADIFNRRGASYHRAMTLLPLARREEFARVLAMAELRDGQVVCDIPSGGGYLRRFIDADVELICIDTSRAFLLGDDAPADGARRVLADLYNVPLADASADAVISLAGLHHVERKADLFREARRLLKRGGRFCVADVQTGSPVESFLDVFADGAISSGHRGDYLCDTTRSQLRDAGFAIASDALRACPWRFASAREMAGYCKLLFGMDKADESQVLEGIRRHVGYQEGPAGCAMKWELAFIGCAAV